jgi:hypothetical protein
MDLHHTNLPNKVVLVTQKSRAKFPMKVAPKGATGIVKNAWVNSFGTVKLVMITHDGNLLATTDNCIEIVKNVQNMNAWLELKTQVELGESIPVLAKCLNIGKKAYRFELIHSKEIIFVQLNDRINDTSQFAIGKTSSVNIPIWVAKKNNIL